MRGIVWGYTMEDANTQLCKIIEDYERIGIPVVHQRFCKYEGWVQFENGDYWKARLARDFSRGHRANISYIDRRIEQDWINVIIRPQTTLLPYQAYRYYGPYPEEDKGGKII